jgi:predicted nucleic acid-binding protein
MWVRRCGVSILVDTGAWYALADASDRHHQSARAFYIDQVETGAFVTTDLILAETWSLLQAHLGRPAALTFWSALREMRVSVAVPDPTDLEAARRIAQAHPDQALSFVDCTTFATMERLGITDAFAFDAHFLVYRFGASRQRAFRRLPA